MINHVAPTVHPTPLQVVLHALTLPAGNPHDDLTAGQGCAHAQHLLVTDRIVNDTQDRTGTDDPSLRRGYSRLLHALADPATPVHGVVAVSRTAITTRAATDHVQHAQGRPVAAPRRDLNLTRPPSTGAARPAHTSPPPPRYRRSHNEVSTKLIHADPRSSEVL